MGDKMRRECVREIILESIKVKQNLLNLSDDILSVCEVISKAYKNDKKLILFGNGGSAADAQHIAAELVGKFKKIRKPLPAIVLHGNTSSLTAISNDFGYEFSFERQIEAFVKEGDVVIGISTSGKSENVVRALLKAKMLGATTVALTGEKGMKCNVDYEIKVPSNNTARIQEAHILIGHIICECVEKDLFGENDEKSSFS